MNSPGKAIGISQNTNKDRKHSQFSLGKKFYKSICMTFRLHLIFMFMSVYVSLCAAQVYKCPQDHKRARITGRCWELNLGHWQKAKLCLFVFPEKKKRGAVRESLGGSKLSRQGPKLCAEGPPPCVLNKAIPGLTRISSPWWRIPQKITQLSSRSRCPT